MFCVTESEIQFLCRPADEIINVLSSHTELGVLKFLKECERLMCKGTDFKTAWKSALASRENVRYLDNDDVSMLASFGELFGVSDSSGQISNCRLHSALLKEKLDEARDKRDRYASLSCGMGLITGIGVIIIFI